MENPVWNQVLAAFETQRERNEQENERRRREIAEKYPDLDAVVKSRHEMVLGAVRGAFSDGKLQSAEAVMAEYNQKLRAEAVRMPEKSLSASAGPGGRERAGEPDLCSV